MAFHPVKAAPVALIPGPGYRAATTDDGSGGVRLACALPQAAAVNKHCGHMRTTVHLVTRLLQAQEQVVQAHQPHTGVLASFLAACAAPSLATVVVVDLVAHEDQDTLPARIGSLCPTGGQGPFVNSCSSRTSAPRLQLKFSYQLS